MRRSLLVLALTLAVAVTVVVAACGGSSTTNSTTPSQAPSASGGGGNVDAAALFSENCAGCHKADGSGGFGPDLRNETDSARVSNQITNGGAQMPAFGGKLSSAQIQALTQYVIDKL